jgi:phage antirepressor YoqD-like protein
MEIQENNILPLEFKGGRVSFRQAKGRVYLNATEMAKPYNKYPYDYIRSKQGETFIEACKRNLRTSENQLVVIKMGSPENGGGTWLYEDIAVDFAQWLDVDFKFWCIQRIKDIFKTGLSSTLDVESLMENPDILIMALTTMKELRSEKKQLEKDVQAKDKKILEINPKAEYYDQVLQTKNGILTTIIAKELGMTGKELNKVLHEMKIIYPLDETWVLYKKYQNKGYMTSKTVVLDKESKVLRIQNLWTALGREFIHEQMKVRELSNAVPV